MMRRFWIALSAVALCACGNTYAQQHSESDRVSTRWLADSLELGKPVPLALTVLSRMGATAELPDSATGWQPWEYVRTLHRSRQPVGSDQVADSLVVLVRSFSIAPLQSLRAHVLSRVGLHADSLWFATDSIPFKRHVMEPIKGQDFRPDVVLIPLTDRASYWGWAVLGALVVVTVVVGVFFLRRPVRQWLARRRVLREYKKLRLALGQARHHSPAAPVQAYNQAMALARQYLEPGWQVPLRALTHRELAALTAPADIVPHQAWQEWAQMAHKEERVNYARQTLGPEQAHSWLNQLEDHLASELERRLSHLKRT